MDSFNPSFFSTTCNFYMIVTLKLYYREFFQKYSSFIMDWFNRLNFCDEGMILVYEDRSEKKRLLQVMAILFKWLNSIVR